MTFPFFFAIVFNIFSASNNLLLLISHLTDSGIKYKPAEVRREKRPPTKCKYLQSFVQNANATKSSLDICSIKRLYANTEPL